MEFQTFLATSCRVGVLQLLVVSTVGCMNTQQVFCLSKGLAKDSILLEENTGIVGYVENL
jgi:hypothetical protein